MRPSDRIRIAHEWTPKRAAVLRGVAMAAAMALSMGLGPCGVRGGAGLEPARVPAGRWGGEHVEMQVTDEGARIEYDCAHGTIDEPMLLDAEAGFDVTGRHVPERGGPEREDEPRASRPARYAGRVTGNVMRLTVSLADTKDTVGRFLLTQGRAGVLRKCL